MLKEIKDRKSPLIFENKQIKKEILDEIMEASKLAPSCFNKQPWNYLIFDKKSSKRKELENCLNLGNSWAKKAPVLIVLHSDKEKGCVSNDLDYFLYDCGLSVMSLIIQAENFGIGSHQMAGWDKKKLVKLIPKNETPIVIIAMGYPMNPTKIFDKLNEDLIERITKPRTRKKIEEIMTIIK